MHSIQVKRWSFRKVDNVLDAALLLLKTDGPAGPLSTTIYYIGASLFIDFEFHPSVCLNRNGRGFFYNFKFPKEAEVLDNKEVKFVMTNQMRQKVLDIYELVKGRNKAGPIAS